MKIAIILSLALLVIMSFAASDVDVFYSDINQVSSIPGGLFAIQGLQSSYNAGQTIDILTYSTLTRLCTGKAYIRMEIYSARNDPGILIGTNIGSGTYQSRTRFTLPADVQSGTWSASGYISCDSITGPAANYNSLVNELNFNIVGVASCSNACASWQKICDTYAGYVNRYISTCGNYDSDICLEFPTSTSKMQDCGAAYGCDSSTFTCKTQPTNCGNGVIDNGEICDTKGPTLGGETCISQGYDSGNLGCNGDCQSLNTANCKRDPSDEVKFKVEIIDYPKEAKSQEEIDIRVKITNIGGSREPSTSTLGENTMNVEAGMYYDKTIEKEWGLFAVSGIGAEPVANCEPNEVSVATKKITLPPGQSTTETFTIKVPKTCGLISTDKYDLLTLSYINCYNTGEAVGMTSYSKARDIAVNPELGLSCDSCTDGLLNGDESDTDCGGKDCDPCRSDYKCINSNDCEANLICDKEESDKKGLCKKESEVEDIECNLIGKDKCRKSSKCYWIEYGNKIAICKERKTSLTFDQMKDMTNSELEMYSCKKAYECDSDYCAPYNSLPKDVQETLSDGWFNWAEEGICAKKKDKGDFLQDYLDKLLAGDPTYIITTIIAFIFLFAMVRPRQ